MSDLPVVRLHRGRERRLRAGHAWVYSNELDHPVRDLPPGGAVRVVDAAGRFVGIGHAHPGSLIAVRLLSRDPAADVDDPAWLAARVRAAWLGRRRLLPDRGSLRVVAGDADGLSGLVVDRYAGLDGRSWLSVQLTSLGMDQRRDVLAAVLRDELGARGAVLRNDVGVRALEGLPQAVEEWWGEPPVEVAIAEGPARFHVDLRHGQKTGFFLDQVANRDWACGRVGCQAVLDACAHTGAWAVRALLAGASRAVAIDVSDRACAAIARHARDNGVADRLEVVHGDVRDELAALAARGQRFDSVFLDPPAYAKTRKKAAVALKAYRALNRQALALLDEGGLLYTSSCSHHVHEDRFQEAVQAAAVDLGLALRLVRRGEQAPDHPVHPAMPETRYLKHLVFQVIGAP